MADDQNVQTQIPAPPPGFSPVQVDDAAPAPPAGFSPVQSDQEPMVKTPSGEMLPASVAARHANATPSMAEAFPARSAPKTTIAKIARPIADVSGDLLEGFGKEAATTLQGVAGLVNKVLPESAQIPQSADDLTLRGPAEHIGGIGEDILELAGGDEVLKGLAKLAKVPEAALALAEKYPKTAKILMGTTKGAALGGAQGAVKGAAPGGEGVVAGAKAGAEGGAIGAGAGEILGTVAKPIAQALGVATDAEADLMRAAQPGKRNYKFIQDWSLAKDRIATELEEGGKFKDMQEAADRIGDVRRDLWTKEVKPAIDAHTNEQMFKQVAAPPGSLPQKNPIAESIRTRITPSMQKFSPKAAKSMEAFAKKFEAPMTVGEAEQTLEHFNAELQDAGYWKKTPSERAAADKVNPMLSARSAAVEAIRDSLYDHLTNAGETGIKDLKRTYGAIRNVENEIRGQVNVGGRQRPISLKQAIGMTAGVLHGGPAGIAAAALPIVDQLYNSPEALLNRAVGKAAPLTPLKSVVQDTALGAGITAKAAARAEGANWIRIQGADGKHYEIHPEDLPEAQKRDPALTVLDNPQVDNPPQ